MPFWDNFGPQADDMIRFACPQCGRPLGPTKEGETAQCKKCNHEFALPTWVDETTCWYCRQGQPTKNKDYTVHLYEITGGASGLLHGPVVTTYYVQHSVKIPVCPRCRNLHDMSDSSQNGKIMWCGFFGVVLSFVNMFAIVMLVAAPRDLSGREKTVFAAVFFGTLWAIFLSFKTVWLAHIKLSKAFKNTLCSRSGSLGAEREILAHPKVRALLSKPTCRLGYSPDNIMGNKFYLQR